MKFLFLNCFSFGLAKDTLFPPSSDKYFRYYKESSSTSSSIVSSMEFASRKKMKTFKRFRSTEKGITELFFNNCGIEELPNIIFQAKSLRVLWLCNNDLTFFSPHIENLENIDTLWLNSNAFITLPYLPLKLVNLYMENNTKLISINGIGKFNFLKKLDINGCSLTKLPKDIGLLTNLETLFCHENDIQNIPESIGNLKKLSKLSLHNNQIQVLPKSFGNLSNLKWLSLHFNKLESLPETFSNLQNIQRLSLHQNQLTTLPQYFENCCPSLIVISLFRNKLRHISPEVWKHLVNCQKLSVHQNCLSNIPDEARYMKSLEEIWLYSNDFHEIPSILNELPKLKTIWFHHPCENITNKNIQIK